MNHLLFVAEKIAKIYNLDVDALLDKNFKIYYVNIGNNLLEIDRETYLSKCISSDLKAIQAFNAIQTLSRIDVDY